MNRKLIIFGNGIGMALSHDKFDLKKVMPKVWKDSFLTDQGQKDRQLIALCLQDVDEEIGPTEESQLMRAQIAQLGHELIADKVEKKDLDKWFTEEAIKFPRTIAKYIYNVARQLNTNSLGFKDDPTFSEFLSSLIPFISETRSHVATLNYDTLFYSAFNEAHEIDGKTYQNCHPHFWKTDLTDGYRGNGFAEDNFNRPEDNNFGYYLHLHGSPLIIQQNGSAKKLKRNELDQHIPICARHIILSDGHLKPFLIQRSEVLTLYWRMLEKALKEVDEVILFGYGGADSHLNELINDNFKKPKFVIEWSGSKHFSQENEVVEGNEIPADDFWEDALGPNTTVKLAENILTFTEWDDPSSFKGA